MHPDYTSLSFDYYGADKGRTYDRNRVYRNATLQSPPWPLVSRPTCAFASNLELWDSSEIDKEARNAIRKNLESIFYGVDVGLNRQWEEANSWVIFVYKTNAELDTMSVEDIKEYAKIFDDGWKEVI
jgi:hypothetical protein